MTKKALLIVIMLFLSNCAGTIKIADKDIKGSTTVKNSVVKPMH